MPPAEGLPFAATAMFWSGIISYSFFARFIASEGKRALRVQSKLELANEMHKTLVPVLQLRTPRFEVYGTSHPSDKVGGDLVDAVSLVNGDLVAYLADIAGHGLPASILTGRLKTAARTALLDGGEQVSSRLLPLPLDRLNTVLPQVEEPHLYATFTGLRLGADGSISYALAASPPLLHWHAGSRSLSQRQEPQLPLGLLPVAQFEGASLDGEQGDLLVVATDGILEAANKQGEEFGVDRLSHIIAAKPGSELPELATAILGAARTFGPQFDDQPLLPIRCL